MQRARLLKVKTGIFCSQGSPVVDIIQMQAARRWQTDVSRCLLWQGSGLEVSTGDSAAVLNSHLALIHW